MMRELERLAGGGDIGEVQLAGNCKHNVVVCDNGDRDRQKEGVTKGQAVFLVILNYSNKGCGKVAKLSEALMQLVSSKV